MLRKEKLFFEENQLFSSFFKNYRNLAGKFKLSKIQLCKFLKKRGKIKKHGEIDLNWERKNKFSKIIQSASISKKHRVFNENCWNYNNFPKSWRKKRVVLKIEFSGLKIVQFYFCWWFLRHSVHLLGERN